MRSGRNDLEAMALRNPVIRPGRIEEAPALSALALRSKASWGYSQDLVKLFQAELTLPAVEIEHVQVVELEGRPVAFYSLQPVSTSRVELGHLFVEPSLLRHGLGRLMIADALRRASAGGFRVLEIQGRSECRAVLRAGWSKAHRRSRV